LVHDDDRVTVGQVLLILATGELDERLARNHVLQAGYAASIADLHGLIAAIGREGPVASVEFQTPALRQEFAQHLVQAESYRLAETKARNELARYTTLAAQGIATRQELDNTRYEVDRLQAESRLVVEQTLSRWQSRLHEERTTLAGLISEEQRLGEEARHYILRAPASGVLVGFSGWSPGGFVTAGQSLGMVSPDDALLVETHVSPRDVGLVRVGQSARLQVDAYPYTQWGTLDGTVETISGDLGAGVAAGATGAPTPGFKVMVRPAVSHLRLPGGVRGELKKGLTLSARFLVARRTVFQLLYDDVSAWLNPQDQRPAA